MKITVMCGNPVIGFRLIGPFDDNEDAIAWADENVTTEYDWWLMPLDTPNQPQGESK